MNLYTYDSVTDVETLKQTFDFEKSISGFLPSGGFLPQLSFVDSYNSRIYLKEGGGSCGGGGSGSCTGFMVYDYKNDTMTSEGGLAKGQMAAFQIPWGGKDIVSETEDGSIHIGENSLVTIEENGAQSLYATNAAGQPIDINITRGSNLLVNGSPVGGFPSLSALGGVSRRQIRNLDRRAVALSSALSALPNYSGDSPYSCGMGMGIRGDRSAMAIGCATDFSHFGFSKNMPSIIKNASFNAGSSFLMHDDPDYTFKVGMTFNFDGQKRNLQALKRDGDLRQRVALLEHTNKALANKTTLAVNHLDRGDRKLANQTALAVTKLGRENRLLQARMKVLQSDREELLAIRADNDAMRRDNELLKAQIAQINELLMGEHQLVARQ